ncbi:MAG: DUF5615 family PIN-like protein [Dehalococcoidia bacterium]
MIPLYVDEDSMDRDLMRALRAHALDVVTVQQRNARGRTDEYQLVAATAEQRAIYSRNARDFSRLHAEFMRAGRHHAGIILVTRSHGGIGEEVRRLLALCMAKSADDMRDSVEYLSRWG